MPPRLSNMSDVLSPNNRALNQVLGSQTGLLPNPPTHRFVVTLAAVVGSVNEWVGCNTVANFGMP